MSNQEIITRNEGAVQYADPINRALNAGAVAIESERAIAEAQGQLTLAKKFPRDEIKAHAELMRACKSPSFAAMAFYSVPNRGSGPSIRFAEEVARVYGNFQYGHRELSRDDKKSEVEVFAWDMEKNNRSIRQITVEHVRYTKNGTYPLKDPTDIDNRIANVASKQIRGRILALMPKWMVAEAIEQCQLTIKGENTEPIETRVRKMAQRFEQFGVSTTMLERYLGHPLVETTIDEIVDLTGVFNSLREGVPASEIFNNENTVIEAPAQAPAAQALQQQVEQTKKEQVNPAPKQQTKPANTAKPAPAEQNSKQEQQKSKPAKEQSVQNNQAEDAPWLEDEKQQQAASQQPEPEGELFDSQESGLDYDPF